MYKETIKYVDYNGDERSETFYFNLSKAEITEMELAIDGGLSESLRVIMEKRDIPRTVSTIKDIILRSYGIKSPDGKRFMKSDAIREEFLQTEAYSELFTKMLSDAKYAAAFMQAIIPADLAKAVEEYEKSHPEIANNVIPMTPAE